MFIIKEHEIVKLYGVRMDFANTSVVAGLRRLEGVDEGFVELYSGSRAKCEESLL